MQDLIVGIDLAQWHCRIDFGERHSETGVAYSGTDQEEDTNELLDVLLGTVGPHRRHPRHHTKSLDKLPVQWNLF